MKDNIGIITNVVYENMCYKENATTNHIKVEKVTFDYMKGNQLKTIEVGFDSDTFLCLRNIVRIDNEGVVSKLNINDLCLTDLLQLLKIYNAYVIKMNDLRMKLETLYFDKAAITNENIKERINKIQDLRDKIEFYEYLVFDIEKILHIQNTKVKTKKNY